MSLALLPYNSLETRLVYILEDDIMSAGKIVQIIGAVVDVQFPRDSLPKVYEALKV